MIKLFANKKFLKYFIWGWMAALLDLMLLRHFTSILWEDKVLIASCLAFLFSFSFWFAFQKYITFADKQKKVLKQWLLFLAYQLAWQWLNLLLLYILATRFWIYYFYVAIFNKWVIFIWNYLMNYFFNFKK